MSATVNTRIQLKRDTTEHWNNARGFIPLAGEVIIYEDYETKTYIIEENGKTTTKTINIPNIKIGTGNAYVLMEHVINQDIHVTLGEKVFWNNKINVDDAEEIITGELEDETLILNRN